MLLKLISIVFSKSYLEKGCYILPHISKLQVLVNYFRVSLGDTVSVELPCFDRYSSKTGKILLSDHILVSSDTKICTLKVSVK